MKEINIVISILMIVLSSCDKKIEKDEFPDFAIKKKHDNGNVSLAINIDEDSLFHGLFYKFYENGNIKLEVNYSHGYVDGYTIKYNELDSGKINFIEETFYIKGEEHQNKLIVFDSLGNIDYSRSTSFIEVEHIENDTSTITPYGLRIYIRNRMYDGVTFLFGDLDAQHMLKDTFGISGVNKGDYVYFQFDEDDVGTDTVSFIALDYEDPDGKTSYLVREIRHSYPIEIKRKLDTLLIPQ
ncbi:MAG: hypothetical protein OEW75_11305 [Cyclobacteriaceae bacterium]|nr:hypothetical protein [Cyclobacteriaceae bacterium]